LHITVGLMLLSVVFIVIGSNLLVNTSLSLGSTIGLSSGILGTIVLAIATSVPNTWAALSLARRGFGAVAVSTTFSSNSINAAIGAGLPSLIVPLHASGVARALDAPWLVGMTVLALAFCATHWSVNPREGSALIALYAAFIAVYLAAFN
jgi:cation:H+ antiporter